MSKSVPFAATGTKVGNESVLLPKTGPFAAAGTKIGFTNMLKTPLRQSSSDSNRLGVEVETV